MDLYLKADDAAAMEAALRSVNLIDDDGMPVAGVDLDRIGTIQRVTGYNDGTPILKTYNGFHANVRMAFDLDEESLATIEPFTVKAPETPYRVWG